MQKNKAVRFLKRNYIKILFYAAALLSVGLAIYPQNSQANFQAPVGKVFAVEQPDKLYDVPLDTDLQTHIRELCENYGVDMPLVLAVIGQESNYDPAAIGDNGNSIGLMQIQPMHHRQRMDRLGITDLLDPYQNVAVGIDLLSELLADSGDAEWAVTAYNAGVGTADFNKAIGAQSEYTEGVLMLREETENESI